MLIREITRLLLLLLFVSQVSAGSTVNVYPRIDHLAFTYTGGDDYAVTVNATNVIPVRTYGKSSSADRNYYHASFGFSGGPVDIEVDAKEEITSWSVSPKAYDIQSSVTGTKLSFSLDRPRYLVIMINGKSALYILADAGDDARPPVSGTDPATGKRIFNVTAAPYNADNTGQSLSTTALQQAIDAAKSSKGIVYVPAGIYVTGRLKVEGTVWIYLEPGSVILANPDRAAWRADNAGPDHVIDFAYTNASRIYGRGTIHCQGLMLANQQLVGYTTLRIKPMRIRHSIRLMVEGITMIESTAWTVALEYGTGNSILNVKILNHKSSGGTNDGIDIIDGGDVTVRRCFIATMDDAVCVKGMYVGSGPLNVDISDVVTDSVLSGLKIGMQGMREISNIRVSDLNVIRAAKGIDIVHYNGTQGSYGIRIEDSRIETVSPGAASSMNSNTPFRIYVNPDGSLGYPAGVGPIRDVELARITIDNPGPNTCKIQGYDSVNCVSNVRLNDIFMNGRRITASDGKVEVRSHATNIWLQGELISPASREEIYRNGFESGAGDLVVTPGWKFERPNKSTVFGPGNAQKGDDALVTYPGGDCPSGVVEYARLPAIRTIGMTALKLEFKRWLDVLSDETRNNSASVEYSLDGSIWAALAVHEHLTDTGWQAVEYPLPVEAEGKPAVYLRFGLLTFAGSATESFGWCIDDLTVTALVAHEPPRFTSTPVTQATVGREYSYRVTTSDTNTPDSALRVNAGRLPAGLRFAADGGGGGTITGLPAASGIFPVSLTVQDGIFTTNQDFNLDVTPEAPDPKVFADWRRLVWPAEGDPAIIGWDADPDKDGIINLLEWALHLDPMTADAFLPDFGMDAGSLIFSYTRRKTSPGEVDFLVEWSDTLGDDWSNAGVVITAIKSLGETAESVTATIPASQAQRRFVRVRIFKP